MGGIAYFMDLGYTYNISNAATLISAKSIIIITLVKLKILYNGIFVDLAISALKHTENNKLTLVNTTFTDYLLFSANKTTIPFSCTSTSHTVTSKKIWSSLFFSVILVCWKQKEFLKYICVEKSRGQALWVISTNKNAPNRSQFTP